jgi:predicted Zn-dependent protease
MKPVGKRTVAAIDNLEAILARGQDSALLRFGLGQEYLKLDQIGKAVAHLRKAVELDAGYSAAWKLLGKALADAGYVDDARRAYESGIRAAQDKGDIQAAKEMGVFLKRLAK